MGMSLLLHDYFDLMMVNCSFFTFHCVLITIYYLRLFKSFLWTDRGYIRWLPCFNRLLLIWILLKFLLQNFFMFIPCLSLRFSFPYTYLGKATLPVFDCTPTHMLALPIPFLFLFSCLISFHFLINSMFNKLSLGFYDLQLRFLDNRWSECEWVLIS